MTPDEILRRLHRAINDHDLDAFLACMAEDYLSAQPAHPDRAFGGRSQVEENWGGMFRDVPDFQADVVASSIEGDTIWTEWDWHGTSRDGSPLQVRGVTLFGVEDGLIGWGRLYMEDVEVDGPGIREAVRRMREGRTRRGSGAASP